MLGHDLSKIIFFTALNLRFSILIKSDNGLIRAKTRSGCLRIKIDYLLLLINL